MAEENQDPEDENLQDQPEEEPSADSPIDQNSIEAMVQSTQGSQSDELESLLEDLGNDDAEDIGTSDADRLENFVENLESEEGEGNPDDILYQATLQDVAEAQEPASEAQVPVVSNLDGEEAPYNQSEDVVQTEGEADIEASGTADLTETEEETELEGEELEDFGSLLEDLDQPTEDASETESIEEATEDIDSLTEELEEPPSDSEIEGEDAAEGLESLLDDLDEPADTDAAEQEGELEDVESLLEDLDPEHLRGIREAEILEDDGVEDMAELLEDLEESEEVAEIETEPAEETEGLEEVDALLEDLDVANETSPVAEGDIEEGEPVEDVLDATEEAEASEEGVLEAEEDADVSSLLEDLDETDEAAEIQLEDESEDSEEAAEDLLENLEQEESSPDKIEVGFLEDVSDESAETSELEAEADIEDLGSLLEDLEEMTEEEGAAPEDPQTKEAAEETSELEAEEEVDVGSLLDDTSAEDDLDSLFDDDDTSLEDELDADLNVGVEHEVAHMLATGQAAPTPEGEDLIEDFASVKASLADDTEEESGGIVLIVDDDEDNIGLFQDALVEDDYEFMGANTSDEALDIVQTHDVDLVLVNLNTANEEGVNVVARLAEDDIPRVPVVVTSEQSELIGDALLAGATDHFVRPLGIVDLECQVPRTVSNLIKLKRAQHVLAVAESESKDVQDAVSSSSSDLDDLLSDEDDDFHIDDDDNLFGDDDNALTPADRLYPLTDQSKMIREKERAQKRKPASNLPMFLGIGTLMILLSGLTGLATMYFVDVKQQEMADKEVIQRPQPVPVLKPPKVQQAGYEISRSRVRSPDDYQRQAESVKARIRNTVRDLDSQNGSWWSPWRVMREAGGSVAVLVQGRNSDEIIEAFGVDRSVVREGLGSRRSLNYLRGVGYDLEGKDVDDLTSRETFELLSAREIKSQDQIVNVLSKLTDRLATDKTEQAKNRTTRQKRQGTASLTPSRPKQTTVEHPDLLSSLKPNRLKQLGFAIRLPGVPHSTETG
jgi:CheY-like chemotaxis protein/soluble cytochrome b562